MTDAHAHIGTQAELSVRQAHHIRTILCGTEPASAAAVLQIASQNPLFTPCCALHPWQAAAHNPESMLPYLEKCPIVGETGLDSVWCETPLHQQMDALLWTLDYAEKVKKPVVLHTKGMEREIAHILRPYSIPKVIHWYSCDVPPDDYLDQDCFFTIGPDAEKNPAVRRVIASAPLDRLLVETDGMEAVSWAMGRHVPPEGLPDALRACMRAIAAQRRLTLGEVEALADRNFDALIHLAPSAYA